MSLAVFAADATKPEIKRARENITIAHLIKVIRKVRAETGGRVPLSTGEIYTVWLDHPELVRGRRVLDFAAGCGLAAIACAKRGAGLA